MLASIVSFSVRFRSVVLVLATASLLYGLKSVVFARFDVFPEFAAPQVVVQTEAPGLSAEQVEQLVTRPVEAALNGVAELRSIRSRSIQGVSAVTVVFRESSDIFRDRQIVSEGLATAMQGLPVGVKVPRMGAITSSTGMLLAIGLTSTIRTPMELRGYADWILKPRLLSVPGVSKVEMFGGEIRQIQIRANPERLLAHGLSLKEIAQAASGATGLRGAGFIDTPNQRIVLRTDGQVQGAADLAGVVVDSYDGTPVRMSDVADIVDGHEPKFGDAQIAGDDGILLLIHAQYGANTLEVTRAVEAVLAEMTPAMTGFGAVLHPRLFRPASFLETSLANLCSSLLLGACFVAAVLFFFLRDLRMAFISFVSIPLSLLMAISVLEATGASINTMALSGLAIAIGVVVDDAIIDMENILRRLRERRSLLDRGMPAASTMDVVVAASLEVRGPVFYASLVVVVMSLPVLAMSGVQGRLFAPLATSFILAVLASLLVSLTVTPALCLAVLSGREFRGVPWYVERLHVLHRLALSGTCRRPGALVAGACLLVALSLMVVPFLGGEFLPEFREGHYILHMTAVPGTSLEESLRIGKQVTRSLLVDSHVASVAQQVGRAENGEDTWGTNVSEFQVELAPMSGAEGAVVAGEMREILGTIPGVTFELLPFLSERIEETVSGASAQVAVKVFGDDLATLDEKADEIATVLAAVPGAVDVHADPGLSAPEVVVALDQDRVRSAGLRPGTVLEAVRAAYDGTIVAQTFNGNRVTDVAVLLDEDSRRDPERVGDLLVGDDSRILVPLKSIAAINIVPSRTLVTHEAARRRQQVTCNVTGRDPASFVAEAKSAVARKVSLPHEVYLSWEGAAEGQHVAQADLLVNCLLAMVGIGVLLAVAFANGRNLVLLLVNMPFAFVGGISAVVLSGGQVSVGTMVGFVALFGITARNSIMLLSHYEQLVLDGREWNLGTALDGTSERLVPILMTVLVTGLGLLPLALSSGEAGHEIEGPMAVVIVGGLLSSTILNLLVLPVLAWKFGRFGLARSTGNSA